MGKISIALVMTFAVAFWVPGQAAEPPKAQPLAKKISLIREPQERISRAPKGLQLSWICESTAGVCYYTQPGYIGGPCCCINNFGTCVPGTITARS